MAELGPESQERPKSEAAGSWRQTSNPPAALPETPPSGAYVLIPAAVPGNDHDSSSFLTYLDVLFKRRWMILAICVLSVVVAFFYSSRQTPGYQASAAFLVEESDRATIAGASDYRPFQSFKNPAEYYRRVALSSKILDPLLMERFHISGSVEGITLLDYFTSEEGELKERFYIGRSILAGCIQVGSQRSFPNLLTLNVSFDTPEVAAEIANRLIGLVSDFDLSIRAKKARSRSTFIASQLDIAQRELKKGEEALEEFQERNRVSNSVRLRTQQGRLERDVKLQSELFVTLRKEQARARIAEENGASSISVLEKAHPPRKPYTPNIRRDVILAGFAGLLASIVLAFVLELVGRMYQEPRENQRVDRTLRRNKGALGRWFFPSRRHS